MNKRIDFLKNFIPSKMRCMVIGRGSDTSATQTPSMVFQHRKTLQKKMRILYFHIILCIIYIIYFPHIFKKIQKDWLKIA